MKREVFVWCFVGALIVAGIGVALWPQTVQELFAENVFTTAFSRPGVNVLFVGDIMLDRNVAMHAREAGDQVLFSGVQNLFQGHDLLVGNLEGTITDKPSVAQQDHSILRFTFDPHFAQLLSSVGFSILSLANNHALDFGEFGYEDTVQYLKDQNITVFGSPFNDQHIAVSATVGDKQVCLVGYMELFKSDPTAVLTKIKEIRPTCSYITVMAHWGVEYQHEPTAAQVSLAHQFIDAGADVIIGSHPHVVESLEIYNNHAIFYSLGNFIFDQGFSEQVMSGLAVEVDFGEAKTTFKLTPTTTYKEAAVAGPIVAQAVLADVVTPSLSSDIAASILAKGSFELAK